MNITSAVFHLSSPDLAGCPPATLPEFAFIGRSNVGKSSLLNMLAGKKDLARVSATPGFTKLINFFTMNKTWRLVDLPGYGFAQVARENKAKFNEAVAEYLTQRTNLICVFVLIDSRHEPQTLDLEFVHWLASHSVPFVLVFTKTDKSKPTQLQKNIGLFKDSIAAWCESPPEILTSSSVTRHGRADLLAVVDRALAVAKESDEQPVD
jgi:GTP-binding protein